MPAGGAGRVMWYKRHLVLLPLSAMVWGRMREKEKDRNEHRRKERKRQEEKGEHRIDLCAGSTQGSLGRFPSPRFSVPGLDAHLSPYNLEGETGTRMGPRAQGRLCRRDQVE